MLTYLLTVVNFLGCYGAKGCLDWPALSCKTDIMRAGSGIRSHKEINLSSR